jgi:hypothetical protein
MMHKWTVGMLATWALLAAATPAAAQTRAHVSGSDSSRRSEPTCVINGDATQCDGSGAVGTTPLLLGPVIVGMGPVLGPVLGGTSGGHATTETDVARSAHHGSAVAR